MESPCPDLSIVVPVYRGRDTIEPLMGRLVAELHRMGCSYEAVLVDDSSPDNSWQVLRELQAAHPDRVTAVRLMRNFGQHNALMCGLRHARGRLIVTMDDDLQHPPEEIPKLLAAIDAAGADVVYGVPDARKHPAWRNLLSLIHI